MFCCEACDTTDKTYFNKLLKCKLILKRPPFSVQQRMSKSLLLVNLYNIKDIKPSEDFIYIE